MVEQLSTWKVLHDPGRELGAHPLDRVEVLRDPVVQGRRHHAGRIDPQLRTDRGHDRLELRGEEHAVASLHHVEGLDAEWVADQGEFTGLDVVHGEGEHPAEAG